MAVEIRIGDALDQLREMPSESVHCCVTSPPYWGLRDYGVDGQIGLEETPDEWCAHLVEVFREVKRVLRKDGTCWVNVGDSYNAYNGGAGPSSKLSKTQSAARPQLSTGFGLQCKSLKPKDLIGQPWLLAFALRADGWYLRDAIVWAKPNPMPESVKDRCTNTYEHVFLLSKDKRYFFDAEAIREKSNHITWNSSKGFVPAGQAARNLEGRIGNRDDKEQSGRNCRNVWTIATEPSSIDHFAMMPTKLAHRCILAGCPVGGTVLDPFGGAGTTALVADRLQRNAILIELNAETASKARRRIDNDRGDLLDIMQQPKPEQGSLCLTP